MVGQWQIVRVRIAKTDMQPVGGVACLIKNGKKTETIPSMSRENGTQR